ncbi:hypothetical protein VTO42DRAFT_2485 [Malbranchea cinnamomea]
MYVRSVVRSSGRSPLSVFRAPAESSFVAGQQLSPFAHSPQARAVLALPGQDVLFGFVRSQSVAGCQATLAEHVVTANDVTTPATAPCEMVMEIVDTDEEDGSQQPGRRPRALITDGSTPSLAILIE